MHLAAGDLLEHGEVECHPFIIGELACGNLHPRAEILVLLRDLPLISAVEHDEALAFVDSHRLMGSGLGWLDVHLLASARLSSTLLWTRDRRLAADDPASFFNRGLVLSQFVARYLEDKNLTPAKFKAQLKKNVDPKFRAFLEGDLGTKIFEILKDELGSLTTHWYGILGVIFVFFTILLPTGAIGLLARLRQATSRT